MKKIFFAAIMVIVTVALTGCGSSDDNTPQQISSDALSEDSNNKDAVSGVFTIAQGNTQSAFAGIDPVTGAESRAFLDFYSGDMHDTSIIASVALVTTTINPTISQAGFGKHIPIDVTALMTEAQRLKLANFQISILENLGTFPSNLIEISDATGANQAVLSPLLQVTYF